VLHGGGVLKRGVLLGDEAAMAVQVYDTVMAEHRKGTVIAFAEK